MAMNGAALGDAIYNALKSAYPNLPASSKAVWETIAGAIVTYIQSNAAVVGSATGVQSGGSTAPVTGTVT